MKRSPIVLFRIVQDGQMWRVDAKRHDRLIKMWVTQGYVHSLERAAQLIQEIMDRDKREDA